MAAIQFRFMALAVNVIDRRGPRSRNKMRHQLQSKKTKVRLYILAVNICSSKICFSRPSLLRNKKECVNFKVGVGVRDTGGEAV